MSSIRILRNRALHVISGDGERTTHFGFLCWRQQQQPVLHVLDAGSFWNSAEALSRSQHTRWFIVERVGWDQVCRFFMAGDCAYGDRCRYKHPARAAAAQLVPPPTNVSSARSGGGWQQRRWEPMAAAATTALLQVTIVPLLQEMHRCGIHVHKLPNDDACVALASYTLQPQARPAS